MIGGDSDTDAKILTIASSLLERLLGFHTDDCYGSDLIKFFCKFYLLDSLCSAENLLYFVSKFILRLFVVSEQS